MEEVLAPIRQWGDNVIRNIGGAADGMTLIEWIRLVAIVGAYLLLRPYIEKGAAKWMGNQHERELDPAEMDKANGKKAKISPNSLRGQVEIPDETSDEEEAETTGAQWGKKARKRQRTVLRKILEAEEKLLAEDDDDDIKEFLESDAMVDYKEGEDGW